MSDLPCRAGSVLPEYLQGQGSSSWCRVGGGGVVAQWTQAVVEAGTVEAGGWCRAFCHPPLLEAMLVWSGHGPFGVSSR